MVTISIIGILSTITFASFSQAQKRARIAKRVSDLKQMQVALEYYYAVNRSYPNTGGAWISECVEFSGGNNVIPGLVPNYIASIPKDPRSSPNPTADRTAYYNCYGYLSYNDQGYIFLDHAISDFTSAADYMSRPELVDPARDGGSNPAIVDGTGPWAWKVWGGQGITW